MDLDNEVIAIVGLGYVGLPLAVEFGRKRRVIGYDVSKSRVSELKSGHDRTLEVDSRELAETRHLTFTSDADDLAACKIFIVVAVPTPIDAANVPTCGR